jgi:hypothetical protein
MNKKTKPRYVRTHPKFNDDKSKEFVSRAPDRRTSEGWFKTIAAALSMVTIGLTLLGYGFTQSLEILDFDATYIHHSPIDFLLASRDVVASMINKFPELEKFFLPSRKYFLLGPVLAVIIYKILKILFTSEKLKRTAEKLYFNFPPSKIKYLLVIIVGGIVPLLAWIPVTVYQGMLILIAILPVIGYDIGRYNLEEEIIKPINCRSKPFFKDGKRQYLKKGAVCVKVENKAGKEIGRGRRIISTSEQIVIFNTISRKLSSFSIKETDVEQVESESEEQSLK